MSFLEIEQVTKTYPHAPVPAVQDFTLSLAQGEIAVLLGASGCGKSTVLKTVAGLEEASSGEIRIDGEPMSGIAPEKRPIAMVFQKALLFRNMTVEQNINFAPRVNRAMKKQALAKKTEEMLELVGMQGLGKKKATELSGGQEQRVSLARALIVEPKLLLLDEPLSALDASLRETMQQHIRRINQETNVTMLMVTHDQREAVAVANKIAVMNEGRVVQYGKPQDFFARPASAFVAAFFGWRNAIPATNEGGRVVSDLGDFELPGLLAKLGRGQLTVRPEAAINIGSGQIKALVKETTCEGMSTHYEVICDTMVTLQLNVPARYTFNEGDEVSFDLDPTMLWFVEA
ncbi:MAG: ABC transporter ATP-binding protein [Coriobacteriales bacterium]|jgi:ABC-type Fe3+/spermidine/putrescine transport system ATPase subunit|nr:ABC transporter ATP-binding protein [Coriobacteriales bacterium]